MKILHLMLVFSSVVLLAAGCGGGGSSAGGSSAGESSCPVVQGVALLNIGSTRGGSFLGNIGAAAIYFNNTNLTFSEAGVYGVNFIADVGTGCLDSITTWPTTGQTSVAMVVGHNYVVNDRNGVYYKFSVDSYSAGVVGISWAQMIGATAGATQQSLTVGTAMTSFLPLTASGGVPPYIYGYTGTLPTGLIFNSSTGAVTGTPMDIYTKANLVFSVKDANNVAASKTNTVSFTVFPALGSYFVHGGLTWMPITFADTWPNASTYCAITTINGLTGWRQPTQTELMALNDSGLLTNGWLQGTGYTWSSTPTAPVGGVSSHISIMLPGGSIYSDNDPNNRRVSCVR